MNDRAGHSQRVTRALFLLSDVVAWSLVVIAVAGAVLFPFVEPAHAQMRHQPVSWANVTVVSACNLGLAIGAHALTRRRLAGLLVVTLAAVPLAVAGKLLPALLWLAFVALVFGTPFALVWREARRRAAGSTVDP